MTTAISVSFPLTHSLTLSAYQLLNGGQGKSREQKLTVVGKHYGVAVLATSSDGWQGCQIRWRESVVEVLVEYLSRNNKTAKNIS